jgi:hypothetical protein
MRGVGHELVRGQAFHTLLIAYPKIDGLFCRTAVPRNAEQSYIGLHSEG